MRGWPPLEMLVVFLAIGLAVVPLLHLTKNDQSVEVSVVSEPSVTTPTVGVFITAKFAHAPSTFRLKHLGETIWEPNPGASTELFGEADLRIPSEGIDLIVEAVWPSETPKTAMELILEPDELAAQSTTHWAASELNAVATYQW